MDDDYDEEEKVEARELWVERWIRLDIWTGTGGGGSEEIHFRSLFVMRMAKVFIFSRSEYEFFFLLHNQRHTTAAPHN